MDGLFWLVWVLAFFGYEAFTLWRSDDGWAPLTYHIRNVFDLRRGRHSPGWWIIAGGVVWLAWHLLVNT